MRHRVTIYSDQVPETPQKFLVDNVAFVNGESYGQPRALGVADDAETLLVNLGNCVAVVVESVA